MYVYTALEVDYHCKQLLKEPQSAVGFDIEWRVTYKAGEAPRKTALLQLCSKQLQGQYQCLLLHIAHSGLTPALIQLLQSQVCCLQCMLYCTVLYCTVLYCTVLYCTVLYCTVLCQMCCDVLSISCSLMHDTLLAHNQPPVLRFLACESQERVRCTSQYAVKVSCMHAYELRHI